MLIPLFDDLGVLLRRDAVMAGVNDLVLHRMVRSGELVRLRHGVYCDAGAWRVATPEDRHRILSHGVMRLYTSEVALSHVSAALAWGGPSWGLDLSTVHLTDLDGTGQRTRARVHHHVGQCRVEDISRFDDHWITSPARTVLDVAGLVPRDAAVCVADHFIVNRLTTVAELKRALALRGDWPQHAQAALAIDLAREGAESPGETRLRLFFHDLGYRDIRLQHPVQNADGRVFALVDMLVEELGLLAEFDGLGKYLRLRRPGETIEQTVIREKVREDHVREAENKPMLRAIWPDLDRPTELERRVRRIRRAA
ncbi:type IV toxin-antitoxin system AbiEi family antitoxin domain-containing protein [Nocardioides fonticola]|uniref:Type IV toxin-antitoxin system AbiEi family antitoxin domain-containing protein n=1 Tax=Nocardioides fonticola TaxID=450363 RepID=A0ABP7XZR6_9ACTN